MTADIFWTKNPRILLNSSSDIWISDHTRTIESKLNAVSRFVLIYGILLSIFKRKSVFMLYTFLILLGLILLYTFSLRSSYATLHYKPVPIITHTHEPSSSSSTCRKSTEHNAFANPLVGTNTTVVSDYCKDNDETDYNRFFNGKHPVNIDDVFGKESSRRQFYSIVKNDQTAFAKSLYGKGPTCKTDRTVCTGYDF